MFFRPRINLLSVIVLLAITIRGSVGLTHAGTVNIQFAGATTPASGSFSGQQGAYTGDGVLKPHWNILQGSTGRYSNLVDSKGQATSEAVGYISTAEYNDPTTPANALLSGYLENIANSPNVVTLTGLARNGHYQLYLYGATGGFGGWGDGHRRGARFAITTGTGAPAMGSKAYTLQVGYRRTGRFQENINYVIFNARANASGKLAIRWTSTQNSNEAGSFNGLQITPLHALRLSSMFSNDMILQCGMADPVWGWAKPGASVTIRFAGQTIRTVASSQGRWKARLKALKVSKTGRPMEISSSDGGQRIILHDVLVGEVWLCSGQSNMQYPMSGWFHRTNQAAALAKGNHPRIRLYYVPMIESNFAGTPRSSVKAAWHRCTPKNLGEFSAVGYFFGLNLRKKLGVPIGLIEADWGGTNVETWIPASGFFAVPQLRLDQNWLRAMTAQRAKLDTDYLKEMETWTQKVRKAIRADKRIPPQPVAKPMDPISAAYAFDYHHHVDSWADPHQNPTTLFNGMISPLIPYAMRGVVWYQGENNVASHDHLYYYHLKALIGAWRKLWGEGDFPFYIVQIAPCNDGVDGAMEPVIWQAEELASRRIANCGLASTMDIGDLHNIHPADKKDVGRRLSLIALRKTYGLKRVIYSGPEFKSADFSGRHVVIHFRHVDGGLVSRNGKPLSWFSLAGSDGKFVSAQANIVGKTVTVWTPDVSKPTALEFAWSDMAEPNLMNKAGLPALPFKALKVTK